MQARWLHDLVSHAVHVLSRKGQHEATSCRCLSRKLQFFSWTCDDITIAPLPSCLTALARGADVGRGFEMQSRPGQYIEAGRLRYAALHGLSTNPGHRSMVARFQAF